MLTREQFFAAKQRRYLEVPIPELGDTARIQSLTELEKSRFEMQATTSAGKYSKEKLMYWRQRLVCLVTVDEAGNRVFSDDDVGKLSDIDGAVTSRIFDAAQEHCGFQPGDIEDMVKNSGRVPVDDSPSS